VNKISFSYERMSTKNRFEKKRLNVTGKWPIFSSVFGLSLIKHPTSYRSIPQAEET